MWLWGFPGAVPEPARHPLWSLQPRLRFAGQEALSSGSSGTGTGVWPGGMPKPSLKHSLLEGAVGSSGQKPV